MANLKDEVKSQFYDKNTLAEKIHRNSFLPVVCSNLFMFYESDLIDQITKEGCDTLKKFTTYTEELTDYLDEGES